jgi:hypothetical protein
VLDFTAKLTQASAEEDHIASFAGCLLFAVCCLLFAV